MFLRLKDDALFLGGGGGGEHSGTKWTPTAKWPNGCTERK